MEVGIPLVFLVLWASGFSVAKIGLRYVEPLTFLAMRYACVVLILLPVQIIFRLPLPSSRKGWTDLCIIGFLIQFVYFGGTYLALRAGLSAGALALIVSMQPILVGIASPLSTGEHVSWRQWTGILFGFIGAAVVIVSKSSVEAPSLDSVLLAIAALLGMTSGVLYEKKTGSSQHLVVATLVQCSVGLALTTFLALLIGPGRIEWSGAMLASLAYLVICNSLIAIMLLLFMIGRQQAARVSALFFLIPPGAALLAGPLVGESMPALAWLGMAIATLGVWIAHARRGA
ncbi:DMT family transporter [Paraburkholderia phenazinium]|jgi:drug/metabolite transporter (DMT)-like permease|nr:DMT family transporter [Paraburkholderia phenazinium]